MPERLIRHRHLAETQIHVQNPPQRLRPQQRRVQLHIRMQPPLLNQIRRNPPNFIRRTTVHGGQRHVVRQLRRNLQLANRRINLRHRRNHFLQRLPRVRHPRQKSLHVRLENPLQIVPHAHVENHARTPPQRQLVLQRVNHHPRHQVLVERLIYLQLLGPLHIVPLVLNINARLGNLQLIQRLNRLQLDKARPRQPRDNNILRHLRMRPRRHAKRRLQRLTIQRRAESIPRRRTEEQILRHAKNGPPLLQLCEHPRRQLTNTQRLKTIRHDSSPLTKESCAPQSADAESPY